MQLLDQFPDRTGHPASDGVGTVGDGSCTRCSCQKLDRHVGVVDIDVGFFGEGDVIICADCAAEIGALVGMISAVKADELVARVAAIEAERDEARALVEEWRPFVTSARELLTAGTTGTVQG